MDDAEAERFLAALAPSDRVHVAGPNGSGKTTLLRRLAGLPHPGSDDLPPHPPRGALVMERPLDGLVGLTVRGESRLRGMAVHDGLEDLARRDVATLSSGEARRVALGLTLHDGTLLLDEPAEGLDAAGLADLRRRIKHHVGPIMFSDHGGALADLATRQHVLAPDDGPIARAVLGRDEPAWHVPGSRIRRARSVDVPAIDLHPGLHVLRGPNGCGKTTWLRHLAGLHGMASATAARFVPVQAGSFETEVIQKDEAEDPLLGGLATGTHPLRMSAGEAHRVALVRAFRSDARWLLLDEPEAHLDGGGRKALLAAVEAAVAADRVVVAATHDDWLTRCATNVHTMEAPCD